MCQVLEQHTKIEGRRGVTPLLDRDLTSLSHMRMRLAGSRKEVWEC